MKKGLGGQKMKSDLWQNTLQKERVMAKRRYRAYLTEKVGKTERIFNALFQNMDNQDPRDPCSLHFLMSSTGNKNER